MTPLLVIYLDGPRVATIAAWLLTVAMFLCLLVHYLRKAIADAEAKRRRNDMASARDFG
jgi:hypothetical protein